MVAIGVLDSYSESWYNEHKIQLRLLRIVTNEFERSSLNVRSIWINTVLVLNTTWITVSHSSSSLGCLSLKLYLDKHSELGGYRLPSLHHPVVIRWLYGLTAVQLRMVQGASVAPRQNLQHKHLCELPQLLIFSVGSATDEVILFFHIYECCDLWILCLHYFLNQ